MGSEYPWIHSLYFNDLNGYLHNLTLTIMQTQMDKKTMPLNPQGLQIGVSFYDFYSIFHYYMYKFYI